MTIAEKRTELAKVEAAITNIIQTGASYQIVGQYSVTNPSISDLRTYRAQLRKEIMRSLGYDLRRTRPNFS